MASDSPAFAEQPLWDMISAGLLCALIYGVFVVACYYLTRAILRNCNPNAPKSGKHSLGAEFRSLIVKTAPVGLLLGVMALMSTSLVLFVVTRDIGRALEFVYQGGVYTVVAGMLIIPAGLIVLLAITGLFGLAKRNTDKLP